MTMIDAALALVADGCAVLPGIPATKRPRVKWCEATHDPDVVRALWARHPEDLPLWLTGAPSGNRVVVDVDARAPKPRGADDEQRIARGELVLMRGDEALAALVRDRGPIPSTREIVTPSMGAHLIFAAPPGVSIGSRVHLTFTIGGVECRTGIDVRGDGGLVVGEGAVTPRGRYVRLTNGAPVAQLSGWLLDVLVAGEPATSGVAPTPGPRPTVGRFGSLTDLEQRIERGFRYVDRMPGAIEGSGGSTQTLKVAIHLARGLELPKSAVLAILRHYNNRCEPPWSEEELEHKADSAEKARAASGYLLTRGAA